MPRNPRNHLQTNLFHVITQGINKSYIFNSENEIKYYIKLMHSLKNECNIKIIAYCIMNNHAHILIESSNIPNLSKYMHRLNLRYSIYYNKKHERVGYVFRDRFKSQGIYSEKQLYNCMKYIFDNPVKAGICKNAQEYKFSNYKKTPFFDEEEYLFIDIDEDVINSSEIIDEYLKLKNINIHDLKKDKDKLKELINVLHNKYNFSLRKIAREINISREKTRKIFKE